MSKKEEDFAFLQYFVDFLKNFVGIEMNH